MAAFEALATGSQDSTGFIATFTDLSPYGTSDEGWTTSNFNRSFVLSDAYNNVLATLPLTGAALSVTYALTADLWIHAQLVLQGISGVPNYSAIIDLPYDRITKNLYRSILKTGCCQNNNLDERLLNADNFFVGSNIEALSGNGAGFNTDIQAAYKSLNAPIY